MPKKDSCVCLTTHICPQIGVRLFFAGFQHENQQKPFRTPSAGSSDAGRPSSWKESVKLVSKCSAGLAALLGSAAVVTAVLAGAILLSGLPHREPLPKPEERPGAEETLSPEAVAALNERYGLEPPEPREPGCLEQLLQGDWGISLKTGR